jgi:tellurite resistance protein TerB
LEIPLVYRSPRPPSDLSADAAEFREPAFRDALIAGVAMVTHADGHMASAERSRFLSLMDEDPALATFPRDGVLAELASHEANYRFDPEVGAEMAREKLAGIAGRTRLCSALVRICRAIIPADGVIHPAEHRALAEIRSVLGVTARPVVFGSYGSSAFVTATSRRTATGS